MSLTVDCSICKKTNAVDLIFCLQDFVCFIATCTYCAKSNYENFGAAYWRLEKEDYISLKIIKFLEQYNYSIYDYSSHYKRGFYHNYGLNLIGKFYNDLSDKDPQMTLDSLNEASNEYEGIN